MTQKMESVCGSFFKIHGPFALGNEKKIKERAFSCSAAKKSGTERNREMERKKIGLEENIKSMSINEEENKNPNPNLKEEEDEELEEGEIVGEEDDTTSSSLKKGVVEQPHPLEHSWTFWFDNPSAKSKQATWGSSMRPIYTFSTIEQFWSLYNNIPHPSKLAVGADFHCFKHKIKPKWEDPVCANGGKWTITFQKGKSDTSWLNTLLALLGEQFEYSDEICGAVVSVRVKLERIALWTKNATNETVQMSIGKQWKELLDYNETIGFVFHDDAKKLNRCAKHRYTV